MHSRAPNNDKNSPPPSAVLPDFLDLRSTDGASSFRDDALRGLQRGQKYLLPKYLYDKRGSELFERITLQPEYYLTAAEQEILDAHAERIVEAISGKERFWLIELGAGSGKKTRRLLSALEKRGDARYIPIDISSEFLRLSRNVLQEEFPSIPMHALCAEFFDGVSHALQQRDEYEAETRAVVYFPGSTIGNFTREETREFFQKMQTHLRREDVLLLAADMQASPAKPTRALHEAYNDAAGLTAEFILNIFKHLARESAADIPLDSYKYVAYYNAAERRVEMYAESGDYHALSFEGAEPIPVAAGERIHIEYSHKFNDNEIRELAAQANFALQSLWKDRREYFSLYALIRV
jgi:dimethylhistidine N-methyltransferase